MGRASDATVDRLPSSPGTEHGVVDDLPPSPPVRQHAVRRVGELSTGVDQVVDPRRRGKASSTVADAEGLWKSCAETLHAQLQEATWKTWFDGIAAVALTDDRL